MKHLFDNRYGTGQSTLAAIDRLTNLSFAGREFCIVGYGWVGKGLAGRRGAGGRVSVVEVDPVAALEAHMDGLASRSLAQALPDADVLIAATGAIDCVPGGSARTPEGRRPDRERRPPRARDRDRRLGPGVEVRAGSDRARPGGGHA